MKQKPCTCLWAALLMIAVLTSLLLCSPALAGEGVQPASLAEIEQQLDAYTPDPRYLAPDDQGGMIHLLENMPPVWKKVVPGNQTNLTT